ncbi:MAG: retropepsin-like aspartic protease, partial [Bacteroidota bacterium]
MKAFRNSLAISLFFLFLGSAGLRAQVVTVPMEKVGNLMFIPLKVNGEEATFVFDTGATLAVLDTEMAEAMGWKSNRITSVVGAGGSTSLEILSEQEFELGGKVTLPKTDVVLRDLSDLEASLGRDFDGIIGYDILANFLTLLDFDAPQIVLYDLDTSPSSITDGYTRVKFRFKRGITIPQFTVSLTLTNGETVKGPIFFDSGAGMSLTVNRPFQEENDLLGKSDAMVPGRSVSLTTQTRSYTIAAAKLSVAGFEVEDFPIRLSGST